MSYELVKGEALNFIMGLSVYTLRELNQGTLVRQETLSGTQHHVMTFLFKCKLVGIHITLK